MDGTGTKETSGVQIIVLKTIVNGSSVETHIPSHRTLLEFLRDDLGLQGTKLSCDVQVCGACTVLLEGKPVSACTTLAWEARGRRVETIEGLATGDQLHPLQQAFIDYGGFQCGFCTPGMIMAAKAMLDEVPNPVMEDIKWYMKGNICRCTGYKKIAESILSAAIKLRDRRETRKE